MAQTNGRSHICNYRETQANPVYKKAAIFEHELENGKKSFFFALDWVAPRMILLDSVSCPLLRPETDKLKK
jgi:hypothetical protein